MKYIKLVLLGLVFFQIACTNPKAEVQKLKDEVLAVHDSIMPQTNKIMELNAKISAKIEILEADSNNDSEIEALKAVRMELKDADDAMMNWMRDYNFNEEETTEVQKEYLKNQMVLIEAVKVKMEMAIANGEKQLQ